MIKLLKTIVKVILETYPLYQMESPVTLAMLLGILKATIQELEKQDRQSARDHDDLVDQNPFDNV